MYTIYYNYAIFLYLFSTNKLAFSIADKIIAWIIIYRYYENVGD